MTHPIFFFSLILSWVCRVRHRVFASLLLYSFTRWTSPTVVVVFFSLYARLLTWQLHWTASTPHVSLTLTLLYIDVWKGIIRRKYNSCFTFLADFLLTCRDRISYSVCVKLLYAESLKFDLTFLFSVQQPLSLPIS